MWTNLFVFSCNSNFNVCLPNLKLERLCLSVAYVFLDLPSWNCRVPCLRNNMLEDVISFSQLLIFLTWVSKEKKNTKMGSIHRRFDYIYFVLFPICIWKVVGICFCVQSSSILKSIGQNISIPFFFPCSVLYRKTSDSVRFIITTIFGVAFGFFIGISFPSVSLTKVCWPSLSLTFFSGGTCQSFDLFFTIAVSTVFRPNIISWCKGT